MLLVRLLFLSLGMVALCHSAPVPRYKPKPRPNISGKKWKMHWDDTVYGWRDTVFARDGYYECDNRWYGSWVMKGDVLEVWEKRMDDAESLGYVWRARVKEGTWEGVISQSDSSDFRNARPFKLVEQK